MARLIPLDRLKDPEEPNPYEGYRPGNHPEPLYDMLIVGRGMRQAFKGGVLVDERTGKPLTTSRPVPADAPPLPVAKRRGRPPKR